MAATATADNSLRSQPNAHNGSSALFRLGAPSQGIFFLRVQRQEAVKRPPVGARRMPQWLGGFSAFNLPRPGRLWRWGLGIGG